MAFKEIETGVWKPEKEGEEIVGAILSKEENVGTNNSNIYTLEVEDKPIAIWGSTVLDTKMVGTKIGDKVKIIYDGLGEAKGGKSAPKLFRVFVDREDSVEVQKMN